MVNLLRIKLVNFAGLYTATGLTTIEIDRSDSKNNIVLILGNNGSGKSSLMNEITLLPLENVEGRNESRIIKGKDGLKEIDLIKDESWLYHIVIQYPSGKTTKCYITKQKIGSDEIMDLNPNGNVSSYLDTIELELGVTKCYTNIGYLSSSVSNFLQMKPTERNSFISEWIADIETFLEGYKNVSKKSFHVKREIDVMNRDIGKLDADHNEIELERINKEISNIEDEKQYYQEKETKLKTYNEQIKNKMVSKEELYTRKKSFIEKVRELDSERNDILVQGEKLNSISSVYKTPNELMKRIYENDSTIKRLETIVSEQKENIFKLKTFIMDATDEVASKYDCESKYTITEILDRINQLKVERDSLFALRNTEISISEDIDVTNVLIIENMLYDIFHKLKDVGFDTSSNTDRSVSELKKENLRNEMGLLNDEYNKNKVSLDEINTRIYSYTNNALDKSILDLRPKTCDVDCGIINELMNYYEQERIVPKLEKESKTLQERNTEITIRLEEIKDCIEKIEKTGEIISWVDKIVYTNLQYMQNYPTEFTDIINTDSFNISSNIHKLIDINNDIKEASSISTRKKNIESALLDLQNNYNMLVNKNRLKSTVDEKTAELEKATKCVGDCTKEIETLKSENKILSNVNEHWSDLIVRIEVFNENVSSLDKEKRNLLIFNEHLYINRVINDILVKLESKILELKKKLRDLEQDKEKVTSVVISKQRIEDMRNDALKRLERYNVLSNIWSPKIGYPSWKIQNFTNLLKEETNRDLREMWGDGLQIHEIRIGSNEFSIVINRNGTIIGDVIACSSGEQATLALALSFAILKMNLSNIAYNVIRLDELDGPFDVDRRTSFIDIVNSRLDDLKCQTCFIVSHNNEFDSVDCDVVLLKGWKNIPMRMDNKNVLLSVQ